MILDVFILTRNRYNLLVETINSILAQTRPPARIVVLDNQSTDDTPTRVRLRYGAQIEVRETPAPLTVWQNFARAVEEATGEYVMIAHDDDLYHPDYFQIAATILAERPGLGLVVAGMSYESAPSAKRWKSLGLIGWDCPDGAALARRLYAGFGANFGSSLYCTSVLREVRPEPRLYGPFSDRPLLFAVAERAGAYLVAGRAVQYRLHAQQDTQTGAASSAAKPLLELQRCYGRQLRCGRIVERITFYRRALYNLYDIRKRHGAPSDTVRGFAATLDLSPVWFWFLGGICFVPLWLRYRLAHGRAAFRSGSPTRKDRQAADLKTP